MTIACIILSSLALLAAVTNIILFFGEKKREAARRQAILDYINNISGGTVEAAEEYARELFDKEIKLFKTENGEFFAEFSKTIHERFERQQRDIDDLKNGACPDYEKALTAANAVNDFNAGISAIMNFDPIAAVKARRQSGDKEVS